MTHLSPASSITPALRVASYNVQKCVGHDLRRRPGRILRVLDGLDADIVLLQEVDKRLPPRPSALPAGQAAGAGWQVADLGQPGGSLGWHGNALLTRNGVTVRGVERLTLPGTEPRGAIMAELVAPQGGLRVIGVHLGLRRRDRQAQFHAILAQLDGLPERPTLIAGDFNEWRENVQLWPEAAGLDQHIPGPSFPALRPLAALDRFAAGPGLRVIGHGVQEARPAHVASDHRPVWIDLALGPE